MKCQRCGKELKNSTRCNFCGYENFESDNVREMSNAERNFYDGLTIDADVDEKEYKSRRTDSDYNSYWQRTSTNFGTFGTAGTIFNLVANLFNGIFNGSIFAKIIAALIFLAFAAFMFFVALPLFFVIIAASFLTLIIFPRIKNKFFGRRF